MARLSGRIRVLSDGEMDRIHDAALHILETVGMRIDHDEARSLLGEAGCRVDMNTFVVRFPRALVEDAVTRLRAGQDRFGRRGLKQAVRYTEVSYYRRDEELHHDFTVNAGGFCTRLVDLDGVRRPATMDDVHRSFALVNALDDITYAGLPCSDQTTPPKLRPVKMAAELVKYTTRPGGIETFTVDDVRYIGEIAVVVRGGIDELRRRPCLVGYGESRSPLALDRNMTGIFIEHIRCGLPQSIDCMPNAGLTSPATGAGTLAQGLAETLAGLVLGYAVDGDAVLSLDFTGGYCDMRSMLFRYAGPDRMPLLGARIQLLRDLYGITSGVHGGKTNACEPGFQAGMEKMESTLFPLLCGASGIGTIGQVEHGMTYSPLQLVLDVELVRGVRLILRGFDVTDETLALDVVERVGPGGNFMADPHTAEHFRDEFWLSDLTECHYWDSHISLPVRGMEARAGEKARALMEGPPEPVLDDDRIREIDAIVAHAARHYSGG